MRSGRICSSKPTSPCPFCQKWDVDCWGGKNWNYVKTNKVGGESILFACSLTTGIMQRICSAKRQNKGFFLLECPLFQLGFWSDWRGRTPDCWMCSAVAVQAGRHLRTFQCPGQHLWRGKEGIHKLFCVFVCLFCGAYWCWKMLDIRPEEDLVLQGHNDHKVVLVFDSLFNVSLKEIHVRDCVSVWEFQVVSCSGLAEIGGPTWKLWLI